MKTVIIIPARYASTRYPGKPLVELTLPDGARKSLIQLSWEAACRVTGVDGVYVATDDVRIRDASNAFGADVIMTSETCRNGTERCAEALANATLDADLIVNLQGDAPLTPHWFVEDLIAAMKQDEAAQMATPVLRLLMMNSSWVTSTSLHVLFVMKKSQVQMTSRAACATRIDSRGGGSRWPQDKARSPCGGGR